MQSIGVDCCDDFHAPITIQICCYGRWQDIYVLQKSTVLIKRVVPAQVMTHYMPYYTIRNRAHTFGEAAGLCIASAQW